MRIPGFITRNLRLKALATGLALVTWVGVVYAGNPPESRTVSVHVPQDPASLPSKYVLAAAIPDITVRASGTREHVNAFDPSTLQVSVDYRLIKRTGVQNLPIHVTNTDPNVSLDNVPATVAVDVDVNDSVTLTVTLMVDHTPPAGYRITDQRIDPDSVVVTGPQRSLSGLTVQVHLDLSNKKTNVEGDFNVILYDRFGPPQSPRHAAPGAAHPTVPRPTTETFALPCAESSATPALVPAPPSCWRACAASSIAATTPPASPCSPTTGTPPWSRASARSTSWRASSTRGCPTATSASATPAGPPTAG